MKIRQGEIYLVDFGKRYNSELGKIRPALVIQNDFFNRAVEDEHYRQVLVVPLSSQPIEDDYRIAVEARDHLQKRSYIVTNWLCTLDRDRLLVDKGPLTKLKEEELTLVKDRIRSIL